MWMPSLLIVVLSGCHLQVLYGAPVPNYPPQEMIGFMKSYGYLQDTEGGSPAETLYTEEGFREVIRQVQRFGGLNETGELNAETLALMDSPRCGVPDVLRETNGTHHNRTKRYIIATPGWRKKKLTYFLANWTPKLDPRDITDRLRHAFSLWAEITPLRFSTSSSPDADVVVSFGRGEHGDRYPFDGPGSTLAHAFFPYQHGPQGGDIHFDSDEEWVDNHGKDKGKRGGVDFLSVATHEIGHSLGLAHSTSQDSIMFPYYKGDTEHIRLGYDDVLAMHDLYVRQGMFEDGPLEEENDRDRNRVPEYPRRNKPDEDENRRNAGKPRERPEAPVYPDRRDEGRTTQKPNHYPTHYFPRDRPVNTVPPTRPDKPRVRPTRPLPSTVRPNTDRRDNRPGTGSGDGRTDVPRHPVEVPRRQPTRSPSDRTTVVRPRGDSESKDNRTKVPDICAGKLDGAGLLRNELFVFKGSFMWRFKDRGMLFPGYPVPFHSFFTGLPKSVKQIDAIYQRPTDHNIVIFSGRKVWKYTGSRFTPDSPQPLTSVGLPAYLDSVDAAFVWAKNEKTYFFKGDNYWRYDDRTGTMDEGYPMKIHTRWIGIPDHVDTAVTFSDGQTYFFKNQQYWRFDNIGVKTDVNFPRNTAEDWIGC